MRSCVACNIFDFTIQVPDRAMSRRGGKRRQVVQLDGNNSKLHRYGYSKGLHSGKGALPQLVGDYADSDSDDNEEHPAVVSTEKTDRSVSPGPDPVETANTGQGSIGEPVPAPDAMDDELRNFLSEIEAIPMPEEDVPAPVPAASSGTSSDKTWQLQAFQEVNKNNTEEEEDEEIASDSGVKKSEPVRAYSMFVKGEPEFVNSPAGSTGESEPVVSEEVSKGTGEEEQVEEEIPDEPVTSWHMVQDETTQYYYYWHMVTNEVTWEIPTEYTQYLLLHREYTERVAKYSSDELQRLKEKKARKSGNAVNGTASRLSGQPAGMVGPQVVSSIEKRSKAHPEQSTASKSDHSTESSSHNRHHRHEKKKKSHKTKKHKHRHNDYSSGEEGRGRSRSPHMPNIGPAVLEGPSEAPVHGPSLPPPAAPVIGPSLPSIVPYTSDQEDTEEEEEPERKHTKEAESMPQLGPELPDKTFLSDLERQEKDDPELSMPVLGSAVEEENEEAVPEPQDKHLDLPEVEVHGIRDAPPELHAEECMEKQDSDLPSVGGDEMSMQSLKLKKPKRKHHEDSSSGSEDKAKSPEATQLWQIPTADSDTDGEHSEPSATLPLQKYSDPKSDTVGSPMTEITEEAIAIVTKEEESESVNLLNVRSSQDDTNMPENTVPSQDINVKSKPSRKKKEAIDMFAEDFPLQKSPEAEAPKHSEAVESGKTSVGDSDKLSKSETKKDERKRKSKSSVKKTEVVEDSVKSESINAVKSDAITSVKSDSIPAVKSDSTNAVKSDTINTVKSESVNAINSDSTTAVKSESMEEGELSEGMESGNIDVPKSDKHTVISSDVHLKQENFSPKRSLSKQKEKSTSHSEIKTSSKAVSIVASYGTDDEEEGELKESDVEKSKKKKKEKKDREKKKESRKRKVEEKIAKSSAEYKDDEKLQTCITDTDRHSDKAALVPEKKEWKRRKVEESLEVKETDTGRVLKPSGDQEEPLDKTKTTAVDTPPQDDAVELATEDIDFDDLDDIDRALELALEKKLELKKVELEAQDAVSVSLDLANGSSEATLATDSAIVTNSKEDGDLKSAVVIDDEALRTTVKDMAELALSKLEFLDINTDNLSRLQVLFVELQTRQTDWEAGGLSTQYFEQQLQVAEGLLRQYELSAVPEGWACQWDRANNRYYYRHKTTDRIQWEYPEVKDDPEPEPKPPKESKRGAGKQEKSRGSRDNSDVEDRKSRSSSSRHRKRDEKDKDRSKYDKRSSSHRHSRRKRRRRRDPSSSSEASGPSSQSQTTSRHQHKSKKKKKRSEPRSRSRSPSVEVVEDDTVIEVREGSLSPVISSSVVSPLPPELTTPGPEHLSPRPSPPPPPVLAVEETENPPELEQELPIPAEEEGDIKEAEEEAGGIDGEEMEPEEEEVNTAVISRPPQISIPPHVAAMHPPELYVAPSETEASAVSQPTPAPPPPEVDTPQEPVVADKHVKKKKKDKKPLATGTNISMKKKQMTSMVQKWQKVKKEVEKEEKDKEIRQAAIRQKIKDLK